MYYCIPHRLKFFLIFVLFFISVVSLGAETDTLKVLQVTDIHFCNLDGYHPEFVRQRRNYGNVDTAFQMFLQNVPQETDADLIVITGDMIDYFEAETQKGPWLSTQIEQFVELMQMSTVPVYLTLGNRDISSYWIGESNNRESFQINVHHARAAWIRNAACFKQGTWYSRDFTVGDVQYHFVFLDNGYSLNNGQYLEKTQLDWLEHDLKQAGDKIVVFFMHKYFPVKDFNNDRIIFNKKILIDINTEACSNGILKILNENSNIKAIFVGHGHRNVIEPIEFPSGNIIHQIETAAFSKNPQNWRLLKFTNNSIVLNETGMERIEQVFNFNHQKINE